MQETETVLRVIREPITRKVITGEPVMGKLIRRSGRGRRKRTRIAGTSPAAYFTLRRR
jgi:hypothetical protein